jgi:hypothetical protein
VPPLPRDETSFNRADAIIQGSYISRERHSSHAVAEQSDSEEPNNDGPVISFANASTREIGEAMSALMNGVATPNATKSDLTSSGHANPDVPIVVAPAATAPTALVTPASMVTPNNVCTQVKTQLAINRPYMVTQLKSSTQPNPSNINEEISTPDQARNSSSDELLQKLDRAKSLDQPSLEISTASAQSSSNSHPSAESLGGRDPYSEKQQRDGFSDASRQAMRDASEDAARTARAKEVINQLYSGVFSQTHASQKSSDVGIASASRQVSLDTLPDDHSPSFFDEAMAGTQTHSQSDQDDDPPRLFNDGYSQLLASERERSDTSVSQEQTNSDGQHGHSVSDGVDFPLPLVPANTQQSGGRDQTGRQSSQSSATLPRLKVTEDEGGTVGHSAAITYSEENRQLQPSSA